MTFPRAVLLLCALVALADGAVLEAAGIAALVAVLAAATPPQPPRERPWTVGIRL